MLLAGMRCTRPQSVTAYSANPPGADAMTRSPALRSATSLPTASTSPAHSRPSREPVPNSLPCGWPEATMRSARLRLEGCTRIKTSVGAGAGCGHARTSTPLSPTTAAFTTSPGYRGLLIRASHEPRIGRELSPILNWVRSPDAWPSSARYNAAHHLGSRVVIDTHWLATSATTVGVSGRKGVLPPESATPPLPPRSPMRTGRADVVTRCRG